MSTFLKLHERLILIVLGLLVAGFLIWKFLDHSAAVADKKSLQADAVLQQQTTVNAQLAIQVKNQEDVLTQLVVQVSQENAQLLQAMQTRTQTTVVQVAKDATLPLPALASRWESLADLKSTDITATPTGLSISDAGSRMTVQKLEQLPTLTANLADSQSIIQNKDQQIAAQGDLTIGLQGQISGLNLQIKAADDACKAEISAVKASARKGKLKAFLWGLGVGVGSGIAIMAKVI